MTDYPEITIKYIGEINIGEHVNPIGRGGRGVRGVRGVYPNGTYFLKFTVYYEKKS